MALNQNAQMVPLVVRAKDIKNLLTSSPPELLAEIQNNFTQMSLMWSSKARTILLVILAV